MINLLCKFWKYLMYFSQGILEEHTKVVFMSNALMSRVCSCAICLLSLTNGQSFSLFLCHGIVSIRINKL